MNANETEKQECFANRFLSVYTRIETFLRDNVTGCRDYTTAELAQDFCEQRPGLDISPNRIRAAMNLRNAMNHGHVKAGRYPAYPTPEFVIEVETTATRLTEPTLISSQCKIPVETASSDDLLNALCSRMVQGQISQLPVYGAGKFIGLITERAIAIWVLQCVYRQEAIDFANVPVNEVLGAKADSSIYKFVHKHTTVSEVVHLFASTPLLEAVLVTKRGSQTEELTGIVTRWDLPYLMSPARVGVEDAA